MAKRRKKYGSTFLTKPRFHTLIESRAERSFFMWSTDTGEGYHLSIFGILNGILHRLGWVLILNSERSESDNAFYITGYQFIRKWW